MNAVKPPKKVILYFEALGFELKVEEDNAFIDEELLPIYYFQTKGADGIRYVSTIMADDAARIFGNVSEPFSKRVDRAFGERCDNGHLRAIQPCQQCKKPDGRSNKSKVTQVGEDQYLINEEY